MQIVVNTRLLLKNRLEGIGWFSHQTLKRITRNHPDVHFVFLFDRPYSEEFIYAPNITPLILSPQARHPILYYAWFQHSVKNLLRKMKPDLFLSPDGFLSLGAGCKQVPVIHDINFHHYPKDLKWLTSRYYNYYFPRFAKAATRIATVSEFSRGEISKHYGIDPARIDVVYNGINSFFKPVDDATRRKTREKYCGGSNYFVNVGSLHPRKNIPNLIRAFSLFKQETGADMKLVLAGPEFWGMSDIEKALNESACRDQIIFTGRLPNEELSAVLGSAMALTFVPYYEGFGIPLVEAMEAEIPIITSNISSLPEVAGNAALKVNPFDPSEIKNAMLRIYNNSAVRNELVQNGRLQKKNFSWDKSAQLLWESLLRASRT
ncbi:MAG TPA: glycosyltransferase family 1 protein [Bacteroidia bacterium]|nr:glycosyltransferase family 1 protein [Bacteroidia bacterium]